MPSLDGALLGQVAGTINVETVQAGHRVGEQLQRYHVDDGGEQLVGLWDPQDGIRLPLRLSSPSLVTSTTVAPRLFTSATLAIIFCHRWVRVATPITTVPGSTTAMGPCFSSPAGNPSAHRYESSFSLSAPSSATG